MAAQNIFRTLKHPKSTHFHGRKINPKGISNAFGARDYINQTHGLISSAVEPEEWGLVKAIARNAFFKAQSLFMEGRNPSIPPISKDEMSFFIKFHPLSMIRDGIISQIGDEISKGIPSLIEKKIRLTKQNLTALFAVIHGQKPLSIITSSSDVDEFSDTFMAEFGGHGSALFHPLDKSSWVASLDESSFMSITPEMFYKKQEKSGRALGYPQSAVRNYTEGGSADSMRMRMFEYDLKFGPWLFDSVFVPKIDLSGHILDVDILYRWHDTLKMAVGKDIVELLNLEAKITTIIKLAAAVEREKIRSSSDTAKYD